jgi:hypothetical protein
MAATPPGSTTSNALFGQKYCRASPPLRSVRRIEPP